MELEILQIQRYLRLKITFIIVGYLGKVYLYLFHQILHYKLSLPKSIGRNWFEHFFSFQSYLLLHYPMKNMFGNVNELMRWTHKQNQNDILIWLKFFLGRKKQIILSFDVDGTLSLVNKWKVLLLFPILMTKPFYLL